MKSAYELAMERFGKPKELSDAQKRELADIESRYEALKAEQRLAADEKRRKGGLTADTEAEIRGDLARELARLDDKKEQEKARVRGNT